MIENLTVAKIISFPSITDSIIGQNETMPYTIYSTYRTCTHIFGARIHGTLIYVCLFVCLFVCLYVCIGQTPQPQWPSQKNPAADAPNAASSRNQKYPVAVLAVVLGTTTVAMKGTQSLVIRGPRASGSAKVLL